MTKQNVYLDASFHKPDVNIRKGREDGVLEIVPHISPNVKMQTKKRINFIDHSEVIKINEELVKYKGYTISKNGVIKNRFNNELKVNQGTGIVRLSLDGRFQSVIGGRFIYELFSQETLPKSKLILYKDGDCTNIAFSNLEVIERKKHFKDFSWNYKISEKEEKQIRKEHTTLKLSYKQLAEKYDCSVSTITKIMQGTYRK